MDDVKLGQVLQEHIAPVDDADERVLREEGVQPARKVRRHPPKQRMDTCEFARNPGALLRRRVYVPLRRARIWLQDECLSTIAAGARGLGGGDALISAPLPAGKAVALQPGSFHVMLMELKLPLQKDTTIPLTLRFKDAKGVQSSMDIKVPVSQVAPAGGQKHQHGEH